MSFPSGFDSFDEYLKTMNQRQGKNPMMSASAPATRQAMAQPHAPAGETKGPMTALGQQGIGMGMNMLGKQGSDMLATYIRQLMASNPSATQPSVDAFGNGMGGGEAQAGMGGMMDMGAGAGSSGADAAGMFDYASLAM